MILLALSLLADAASATTVAYAYDEQEASALRSAGVPATRVQAASRPANVRSIAVRFEYDPHLIPAGTNERVIEPGFAPQTTLDDLAGAACSFSAATAVVMADGTTRAISEIKVGDYVLAEDPQTGERGPRRVTHLWQHEDTVVDLEIDGDLVATTEDHPFWNATDEQWQEAQDLDVGDLVRTAEGELAAVGGLRLRSARMTTAFNLTVEGIYTYFVGVGEDTALVHNTCGGTYWNPFKGKTAAEIDEMFRAKGFEPRGPDPTSGYGGYVNPRTGRSYHIDPPEFGRWNEPLHVDVNRPRGSWLPKRKYYSKDPQ